MLKIKIKLKKYRFKREDRSLDKALNESSLIKVQDGLVNGLLLRCMDNKRLLIF